MSVHNEDQLSEMGPESPKKSRMSYTREFLLSLSELVQCQKLPDGFDQSILSEFEDAPQERFRPSGNLSSQSFRRNEHGASPPNRGDANSYSRGFHGKWDSRPSGDRSDRDTDFQNEKESDPGRRYGTQSRRPWQVHEHDGLLGSGSFPRATDAPGPGTGAPKSRAGDQYPLNRTNEPYQPPKPYKAVPHTRRQTNDSYNDETFGSFESTTEDRAEEERKRRASFELMRKEQHDAFQEKQKNPEKRKDDFDITFLVEGRKDNSGVPKQNNEPAEPLVHRSSSDSKKSNVATLVPTSRPLVPPGFSGTSGEKFFGTKPSTYPLLSKVGDEVEGNLMHAKVSQTLNRASNHPEDKQASEKLHLGMQAPKNPSIHELLDTKNGKNPNFPSDLDASDETVGFTDEFHRNFKASINSKLVEPGAKDAMMNKVMTGSSPVQSNSILEKLFSSGLTLYSDSDVKERPTVGASASLVENMKVDDSLSPHMKQSSKFAQLFFGEDKKPVDDFHINRSSDLLSLIAGSDRVSSNALGEDSSKPITSGFPLLGPEALDVHKKENLKALIHQDAEHLQIAGNSQRVSPVLTCEDLEQSILSGVNANNTNVAPPIEIWSGEAKSEQQKAAIDDHASQHLLSLLQKAPGPQDVASSHLIGINASVEPEIRISKDANAGDCSSTENPLTLEALFGTSFMKELKPAGAPPADSGGSVGAGRVDNSDSHGLSFPILVDGPLPPASGKELRLSGQGNNIMAPNKRQQVKDVQEHFSGLGLQSEPDTSQVQAGYWSKPGGVDGPEVGLPQEDNLIYVSDPTNLHGFMPTRNLKFDGSELLPSRVAPPDISGNLAASNSVFREELSSRGSQEPFPHSHGARHTEWSSLHAQPSLPPHLHHSQLIHDGMLNLLESNRSYPSNFNSPMKYRPLEKIFDHDDSRRQFPTNMINRPGTGPGGFDPTTLGPMFQHLQVPGAFPPPHLSPAPRGVSLSSHPSNQPSAFRQEMSAMQGIPFGQRQANPNLGGLGIGPRAPEVARGANHPEALQRLFEMERQSNSRQLHPFAASSHSQGLQGHELDMGYGFR